MQKAHKTWIFFRMCTLENFHPPGEWSFLEEQESLVEVLQHRLAERRRMELVVAVKAARREFKAGQCRPATPAQIIKRIFA